jgi:uncharacterized membrane protein
VYDFEGVQRHGIYRDIPNTASDGSTLSLRVASVTDGAGRSYTYTTSTEGAVLKVKIGDANKLITGTKTYVISYDAYNAVLEHTDADELYWNATGNQWQVPIQQSTATVRFFDGSVPSLRSSCYTGAQGSTETACTFTPQGSTVQFSVNRILRPGEGFTVATAFPKGHIAFSPGVRGFLGGMSSGQKTFTWFIALCALLGGLFRAVYTRALRAHPFSVVPSEIQNAPIVVAYAPPEGLQPIDVGTLIDKTIDPADLSSVIMQLAVRGYIKIRHVVIDRPFWFDKEDYELVKLRDTDESLHPADIRLMEFLFNQRTSVQLSALASEQRVFTEVIESMKKVTDLHLFEVGYFDGAAKDFAQNMLLFPAGVLAVLLAAAFTHVLDGDSAVLFVPLFFTAVGGFFFMVRYSHVLTRKGVETVNKIKGFKEFLLLTEADKLRLLNAPELKPETFEKFLPYAMVLGVEKEWAKKFEGLYTAQPQWYEDQNGHAFSPAAFALTVGTFNTSFVHAVTAATASSGHGSSGGGGGGGGGGSW